MSLCFFKSRYCVHIVQSFGSTIWSHFSLHMPIVFCNEHVPGQQQQWQCSILTQVVCQKCFRLKVMKCQINVNNEYWLLLLKFFKSLPLNGKLLLYMLRMFFSCIWHIGNDTERYTNLKKEKRVEKFLKNTGKTYLLRKIPVQVKNTKESKLTRQMEG